MGRTVYKAEVGISYRIMIIILFTVGLALMLYSTVVEGGMIIVPLLIGAILIAISVFLLALTRTWYEFTDQGLKIEGYGKYAMLNEEYLEEAVPYSSIRGFHETTSVNYSVTFTAKALRIEYIKKNGRKDSFVIGPTDREEFVEELTRRTGLSIGK